MDSEATAKLVAFALVSSSIGWTTFALVWLRREDLTTSRLLLRIGSACPQLNTLFVLLAFVLACEAMPSVNRWVVLSVVVGMYLLGHAQWPIENTPQGQGIRVE